MVPDIDDLEEMDDGAAAANDGPSVGASKNALLGPLGGFASEIPTLDVPASRKRYASRPSNGSLGGY